MGRTTSQIQWATRIAPAVAWLVPRLYRPIRQLPDRPWSSPIDVEHWSAVADGGHNLTTDLLWWRGQYHMVHAASPWHMASANSRILLWTSPDARTWTRTAEIRLPDGDIRDPKLAVIGDRLFLYVLRNDRMVAEPGGTAFTVSDDGRTWAPLRPCGPEGWLFWRPKMRADGRWFVPAYWRGHGRSILLESRDGIEWSQVSAIHEGGHNDETDLAFVGDRAVVTARLEMTANPLGDDRACTLVAIADPPYTDWRKLECPVTRLDGPNLFEYGGEIYAAGRRHRRTRGRFNRPGGFLGRKRTALYRIGERGLVHLLDLPSAGDTGYPGVAARGDELTICYYTNDLAADPSWLVGMFMPSDIRIARLSLSQLAACNR